MSVKLPANFKKYGGLFAKGIMAEMAPGVIGGALVELLRDRKVDVQKVTEWVEKNVSLWDALSEEHQGNLHDAIQKVGSIENIDWLTPDWVINSIRHDFPAVASLFVGWQKASNWLRRQTEIIKEGASK